MLIQLSLILNYKIPVAIMTKRDGMYTKSPLKERENK